MGANTGACIGIRRMIYSLNPPAYRCFEDDGTTQYTCQREPLEFMGTTYHVGDEIAYDGSGSYTLAGIEQLRLFFNQGWIDNAT